MTSKFAEAMLDIFTGSDAKESLDAVASYVDDEYATAGIEDPKVCVTTSRDPSSRLKKFIKEIKLIIPNSQRINRGASKLDEVRTGEKG